MIVSTYLSTILVFFFGRLLSGLGGHVIKRANTHNSGEASHG